MSFACMGKKKCVKHVRIELKDGRERLKICSDGGLDNFISLSATSVISGILECGYEGLCALMCIRAGLRGRNITTLKNMKMYLILLVLWLKVQVQKLND